MIATRETFWIDKYLNRSDGCAKYKCYFKYDCLPEVNGQLIESIWSSYDLIKTAEELDDILAYDKWSYRGYFIDRGFVSVIHPEIKKLFGHQTINGKDRIVQHISFRTSSSGHANPDDIATIYTLGDSISVWDTNDQEYFRNSRSSIHYSDPYFQTVVKTLMNKKFTVKWYNRPDPGPIPNKPLTLREAHYLQGVASGIRIIDGIVYPDTLLDSWRWSHGHPYVSNEYHYPFKDRTDIGVPKRDNIRVWYEPWKSHLYFSKVDAETGDSGLVIIDFRRDEGDNFCRITEWNESVGGGPIRFEIDWVNPKEHWDVKATAFRDGKRQWSRQTFSGMFYKLNRISESYI